MLVLFEADTMVFQSTAEWMIEELISKGVYQLPNVTIASMHNGRAVYPKHTILIHCWDSQLTQCAEIQSNVKTANGIR
jgi:uncharacterized protein involved in tolerance to divalent cations